MPRPLTGRHRTLKFKIEVGEDPQAKAIVEKGLLNFNARIIGERGYQRFEACARDDGSPARLRDNRFPVSCRLVRRRAQD